MQYESGPFPQTEHYLKDAIVCLGGSEAVKYWWNIIESAFCGECILTFLSEIC